MEAAKQNLPNSKVSRFATVGAGNSEEPLMTVEVESTSRESPTGVGEVELLEFFAQKRAWA